MKCINAPDSDGGDLKIVEDGLAVVHARARVHDATTAVRDQRMDDQLRRLKKNDKKADETKKLIEAQLRSSEISLDTLHRALELVNEWLGQPTSYRSNFVQLRCRVRQVCLRRSTARCAN